MKLLLFILFCCSATSFLYAQQSRAKNQPVSDTAKEITIIVKFNKNNGTKDGYYLGGYVVDLDINSKQVQRLNGKDLKITGKLFIEPGLATKPRGGYKKGEITAIRQGRAIDTKHIVSSTYVVVDK